MTSPHCQSIERGAESAATAAEASRGWSSCRAMIGQEQAPEYARDYPQRNDAIVAAPAQLSRAGERPSDDAGCSMCARP
jgi:hypothetical protein